MRNQTSAISDAVRATIINGYDGTTEALNRLMASTGLARRVVRNIAVAGGYVSTKARKNWTDEDDNFIRENWHWMSPEEVAAALGRSVTSVTLRKNRLKIGRFDDESLLTIRDVEKATGIDHRHWSEFIARGWLAARQRNRSKGATPITRISVDDLKKFLIAHPEVIDYAKATGYTRALIEADSMPQPPRYKLMTCQSDSWTDCVKATPTGPKVNHGAATLSDRQHQFTMASCKGNGGTDFWVPLYEGSPSCPRCGCKVSRFSDKALYRDDTPDEGENIDILAQKIGLKWRDGAFRDEDGAEVNTEELLQYVFSTSRSPSKAVRVFHKILKKGMTVINSNPVPASRLLAPLVSYTLKPLQDDAYNAFLATGAVSIEYWPGFGKMFLSAYAMTCLAGDHVVFVNTDLVREQWIEHLRKYTPRVDVQKVWKPAAHRVRVYDRNDNLRCTIKIYSYATKHAFKGEQPVIVVFDESQFLPGNLAHQKALIDCEFRIGCSASPVREDGRAEMVGMLTGKSIGSDWEGAVDDGLIQDVPVTVYLVDDLDHKHRMLAKLCEVQERTIVFSDGLQDGQVISESIGIPFVSGQTKNRLLTVKENETVCISRVGDCGIDVPNLKRVIEFSFHGGARAQSLQRYGRLLHSQEASEHIVLMTEAEHERYEKRLRILREKGFHITVLRAPKLKDSKPKPPINATWLSALTGAPVPTPKTHLPSRVIEMAG